MMHNDSTPSMSLRERAAWLSEKLERPISHATVDSWINKRSSPSGSIVRRFYDAYGLDDERVKFVKQFVQVDTIARDEEMRRMRFDGLKTLEEIGNEFGLTRERVRQILGNDGFSIVRKRRKETEKYIESQTNKTNDELAAELETTYAMVSLSRGGTRHAVKPETSTERGYKGEEIVSAKMTELGIEHEMMPNNHPFDILVFGNLRIDVKTCHNRPTYPSLIGKAKSPRLTFKAPRNKRNDLDFYILLAMETGDMFIVPVDCAPEKNDQFIFSWPTLRPTMSKWSQYLEAWDLLTNAA